MTAIATGNLDVTETEAPRPTGNPGVTETEAPRPTGNPAPIATEIGAALQRPVAPLAKT